ncbi:hypothetical protein BBJ29_000958 [Phytophthora kernoviae]|uniref:FYVE-type domain-containing protein n=1 Tax=Phytophthora kernoviae TaxID=325452 RepID=A0A3F2RXA8_9STRA|nr:hypothetical protein BBJ29_000958 [Phytophthora kernoviae]RLN65115.1 hypothetical protein BBP00_00003030 [Phytophthora kernoviae]
MALPEVSLASSPELKKSVPTDTSSCSDSDAEQYNVKATDQQKQREDARYSIRADSLGTDRSSRAHFKEGIRLAEMGKWSILIERVASEPQLARHKDHHGMLPLHWACTEDDTPSAAVRALLAAFPEAVITKNNAQYLPIHIAVKARAPLETLKLLVDARPSSLMEETPAGKTVLQLAREMQLAPAAMEMIQRAEQDYLDLSEDDDDTFDYEDVKRDIEMQSQLLRESMLHPPSMSGPNASLPSTAPISNAFAEIASTSNIFESSKGMITSLSFVDGALVQSQSCAPKAAPSAKKPDSETPQPPPMVSDQLGKSPTSLPTQTSMPVQTRAPPATGPARSKSARETGAPAPFEESTFGRPMYEPDHNAGVCGVCYKKFSMFRKKYQCKGCFTYLCKKHVAGKIMLPNYHKKRSVCGDCYRIYRNGPMSSNTIAAHNTAPSGTRVARASGSIVSGSGPNDKKEPDPRNTAPVPPPSTISAPSTVHENTDTISSSANVLFTGVNRTSSALGSLLSGHRVTRSESTHSMSGRPSNIPGPQMNMRYSTPSTLGVRSSRVGSNGRAGNNTAISDTTLSDTDRTAEVSVLQYRVASLEECNKVLMTRVADQEKQYNEAMLLLTTTMTRVAEMEIRLPTDQRKSYRGTGGSTTASERASEVDNPDKFSPFMENGLCNGGATPLTFRSASFKLQHQLTRSDMSDPFDFLNPIASTKTPAEKVLGQPHSAPVGVVPAPVAPLNVGIGMGMPHGNMGMGMGMGMGAPPAFNGGMNMGMGGMASNGGMMPGQFPGGGVGHGMNQPNPFGQPQQQQSPVMYDNIKKLLEKKPVVDDASMDFLEGLGGGSKVSTNPAFGEPTTRAPEPAAPVNPFQSNPSYASTELDFNFLGGGASSTTSPITQPSSPASTSKSSALASRLAQGKRPTQEAARKNLEFNAGAFASTGNTPKISLKSVSGGPTSSSAHEPTLDDFASGNASLAPIDDGFAPAPSKPATETAANDIFW